MSFLPSPPRPPSSENLSVSSTLHTVIRHVKKHVGIGIICSVAYFDPGNWSVDLQAGASFGYRPMLFVLLLSGLGAIILQTLACRLGCVTGIDLASHCRLLLHDHKKHPRIVRRAVLYPLYVCAEIAIISTDLAELLGSAIGLVLIFPKLPLWAAVTLTAVDVLIFLLFADPSRSGGRPMRIFELVIIALVLAVFASFVVLLVRVSPHWPSVFLGYLPNKSLFQSNTDAVYTAVGILGATVMPHALFLGSFLATQDREVLAPPKDELPGPAVHLTIPRRLKTAVAELFKITKADRAAATRDYRSKYGERENSSLDFVRKHLNHMIVDVVSSLLIFAVPINSAILILAATVFSNGDNTGQNPIGLFDAHDLIRSRMGKAPAFVFALALLCAGQTSSITATLAGQVVGEGFIEWRMTPFLRRLITRLISLIPSMVVAVAVGRDGIDELLVASQVILSVVLPFIAFPLIYLTSSRVVMRVRKPMPSPSVEEDKAVMDSEEKPSIHERDDICAHEDHNEAAREAHNEQITPENIVDNRSDTSSIQESILQEVGALPDQMDTVSTMENEEFIDYSNGRVMTTLACVIWAVILVANVYAIVMLALGKT